MNIIIMGVAGSGKSTIGKLLAEKLKWTFVEGDDFHSKKNIEKMSGGIPLTDEDRIPWLQSIGENMTSETVISCSALKESYRKLLKVHDDIHFVYLKCSPKLVTERLNRRQIFFFNPSLLESQFSTLEEPSNALVVDAALSPEEIVDTITKYLS